MTDQGKLHRKSTFGKVPEPLIHDMSISHGAARLYAHMHWRYGANKCNFEGMRSMADTFSVSRQTISNWISELEAANWVVTIMRDKNPKTGNYQTPFYHVFEDREDCALFRVSYRPQEGEIIAPKPRVKERKTRKGIGGKATHKSADETQVDMDTVLTPVDSVTSTQVDTIQTQVIQTQLKDSAPNGAGAPDEPRTKPRKKGQPKNRKIADIQRDPEVFNPIFNAIKEHFWKIAHSENDLVVDDKGSGGRITLLADWHCGRNNGDGSGWIKTPATRENLHTHLEYIQAYGKWCVSEGFTPPLNLKGYVDNFRKWAATRAQKQQRQQAAVANAPTKQDLDAYYAEMGKMREFLARERQRSMQQRRLP